MMIRATLQSDLLHGQRSVLLYHEEKQDVWSASSSQISV